MTISEIIATRNIAEVLHFTTNRGLVGTLASGSLKSRPLLKGDDYLKHILHLNSAIRPEESRYFDKSEDWIRFVNLSVSEINSHFFRVSQRWHTSTDTWWAILSFRSEIMTHSGVRFATTNNGYDGCVRSSGPEGLLSLFSDAILRKGYGASGRPWSCVRGRREPHLPTCEQAEVLYPEQVALSFLDRVYVAEDEHHDLTSGWLRDFGLDHVQVLVQPGKFFGRPN